MATFSFTDPNGQSYSVQGPDGATPEQAFGILQQHLGTQPAAPQGVMANAVDFAKSIPGGVVNGLSSALSAGGQAAQTEMGQPVDVPSGGQTSQILQQNVTGALPKPQGAAGRFGESVGEAVGNPTSYIGPGSLPLKIGGAVLSGLGGQAGEEVGGNAGRMVGSMAGGIAAGKTLGPTAPEAAIPTAAELKGAAQSGYNRALASGLKVDPASVSQFATKAQQDLIARGFAPEIAGKTFKVLDTLQGAPAGSSATAANLGALRQYIGRIAQETQPANGGMVKPTPDAAAASIISDSFKNYLENLPQSSVVAGDAKAFTSATREANANYAASQRVGNFDARLTKAENTTDRQVAGSLDSQIKSKAGQMLDNPKNLRGLTQDEINQLQLINSGTLGSNTLRQLGRGGAGVIPLMTQAAVGVPAAIMSGGATVVPQMALAAGLYGARKASEAITKSRAADLADMLAKRSPLYQQRVNASPPADVMSNPAQIFRSGLLGIR
jgi:hypothetical protein